MRSPKITIVISTFNCAIDLPRCFDSVFAQSSDDFEVVVIDGGSTDGTVAEIERRADKIAYWISERDAGIYDAWNKAVRRAKGQWVYFLGADDLFADDQALVDMAKHLDAAPEETLIVYGRVAVVGRENELLGVTGSPWSEVRNRLRAFMAIPHQGVFHRRQLFERHGPFDGTLRIAGDYDMLLRAVRAAEPIFVDRIVARFRGGGASSAGIFSFRSLREFRKAQIANGITTPPTAWLAAYAKTGVRILMARVLGEDAALRLINGFRRAQGKHLLIK